MSRKIIQLKANEPSRIATKGRVLQIVDTGAATSVKLQVLFTSDQDQEDFGACTNKFRMVADSGYNGFIMEATVDCTVTVLASMQNVSVSDFDGGTLTAQFDPGQFPLPVTVPGTLNVSVVQNENGGTSAASYPGTAAVNATSAQFMAANAAAKRVTLYNAGPNTVALWRGPTPKAYNVASLHLKIGETFIEERFAGTNQGWGAVCAAGETASLQIEVVQ